MNVTSPYDGITPESLKASMLADLESKGLDISTREGSYANTLVSVAAYQLYKVYQQFPGLLSMVFPDATSGEYIDKNAAQVGMLRGQGQPAMVTVTFTGTDGTSIPSGTALYDPKSGLQFVTSEDTTILNGTATATAKAAKNGAAYNLPPGSVTAMHTNLAGVDSLTNLDAAAGGVDAESDSEFYDRYHLRRTQPINSGNANHYISWATEVAGVAFAGCVPLWNGNGTVKVVIGGADRGPVDERTRQACYEHIEAERPIGATVTVVSVARRELPLAATVTLVDGYSVEQVAEQLKGYVEERLTERHFGKAASIPYSRFLSCLLQCPGVADYSAFTVDGGTSAIALTAEDAPVVGAVTITEGGA